ncbi:hypothetical protein [Geoalkalibacter sp.]|uniref:hypothetical protein n=1 Tax=Geoalkalibacter sp. TaxID=3041440 RepID=UPI00272DFB41|nr:hypothetical protein [Geoalkalibacter sp.]
MLNIPDPSNRKFRSLRSSGMRRTLAAKAQDGSCADRTLWAVLFFVVVTLIAVSLQHVSFSAAIPEALRLHLGDPPPPHLISLLLSAYFVSSVAVSCHGIIHGTKPERGWLHLALRSVFYLLYFSAGALPENLVAVFLAGLILSVLDHLRGRAYDRVRTNRPL